MAAAARVRAVAEVVAAVRAQVVLGVEGAGE